MPGCRRRTASCAHWRDGALPRGGRPQGAGRHADPVPDLPLSRPTRRSGWPPGRGAGSAGSSTSSSPMRSMSRPRGRSVSPGATGARARLDLHDVVPHAIPGIRAPARADPGGWTWRALRWFHDAAARTLVPTGTQQAELSARGFRSPVVWGRGVDTELFHPGRRTVLPGRGAAPDVPRAGRGRKEHRGLPEAGRARHPLGGRWRSCAGVVPRRHGQA
jgi:hypothetical protein